MKESREGKGGLLALVQSMGRASTGKNKADLAQSEELEVIFLAYDCTG